jgi:hypothetical protein
MMNFLRKCVINVKNCAGSQVPGIPQPGYLPLSRRNFAGSMVEVRGTKDSVKAFLHHRGDKKSVAQYPMTTNDSSQQYNKSVTIPI